MRTWPQRKKRQARIEIIPMIDVMMFLLVFFVLISLNVLPALGLKITPPSASRNEQIVDRKRVMLSIDKDGNTFLDGNPAPRETIPDILRKAREDAQKDNQVLTVVIAGDTDSTMQHLVSTLEILKEAGITSSAIITKNK